MSDVQKSELTARLDSNLKMIEKEIRELTEKLPAVNVVAPTIIGEAGAPIDPGDLKKNPGLLQPPQGAEAKEDSASLWTRVCILRSPSSTCCWVSFRSQLKSLALNRTRRRYLKTRPVASLPKLDSVCSVRVEDHRIPMLLRRSKAPSTSLSSRLICMCRDAMSSMWHIRDLHKQYGGGF